MTSSKFVFILKLLLALFFMGTGLFFILYPDLFKVIDAKYTIIIGVLFFLRGLFRAYATYRQEFKKL